jgi:hypothetical protein
MTTHVKDSSVLGLPRRTCAPVTCALMLKKVLNSCKLVPIRVTQTSLKSQIQNRISNGTPWYGLVHLVVHLGSAKNPMFIGLGTGGTP